MPLGRKATVDFVMAHVWRNGEEQGPAGRMFTPLRVEVDVALPDCVRAEAVHPAAWNDEVLADTSHRQMLESTQAPSRLRRVSSHKAGCCSSMLTG
mmetsp:Transcript_32684/g.83512  ORF Transcript_32684/g.83512 Transcript_32684/m.83512 type:complete len:96 (+) Transcript_32684:777-1064(+)